MPLSLVFVMALMFTVDEYLPPERVRILPICAVPKGEKQPTQDQMNRFMKHLRMCQAQYKKLLNNRDTFDLAKEKPDVFFLKHPTSFYKALKGGASACHYVAELLDFYKLTRFKCPYTFCILFMNPRERWPVGGGRTINGGYHRGGGMVQMSSYVLDNETHFQSTILHELGHSCGLTHVDLYGYDMKTNPSIMSYNLAHRSNGFELSADPGILIPEDIRSLALNKQVFPKLKFDPKKDIPPNYKMAPQLISLGPMILPNHPPYGPVITTPSGEADNTRIARLNNHDILPSSGPGIRFFSLNMWVSKKQADGKVKVILSFPGQVTLNAISIHSGHSGKYHKAERVLIEAADKKVISQATGKADVMVRFQNTTAKEWTLTFRTGRSQRVCLRGLQYFFDDKQLFPPGAPYQWRKKLGIEN